MNKLEEFNLELKKKKIAVIGVGVSNIPLLDYLKDLSANVTIFDKKEITIDMSKYNFKVFTGNDYLTNLKGFDIIFRSPSCLPTTKELVEEANRGAYITTEVEEVIRLTPAKVIGITGSDGKTTTTTLISKVLEANNYHVFLGGNIGVPLFTKIKDMTKDDIVVLELSSFQLLNMRVSPSISVITNISPNHLDYHKDYQEYIDAKTCIYKNSNGILVLNKDNEITSNLTSTREIRYFSRYQKTNYFYVSNSNIYYKDKLIRFHVIANSDTDEDQALKLKVRDAVIDYLQPKLENSNSIQESEKIIKKEYKNLERISKNIISKNGYDYNVKVGLQYSNFPAKQYSSVVLPAGKYKALKIIIGEGAGKNWWCVMFPPLCFVDDQNGVIDEKTDEKLKEILTPEEYNLIMAKNKIKISNFKLKFKIIEVFQAIF